MKNDESQNPPGSGIDLHPSNSNNFIALDNQIQVCSGPMYFAGGSLERQVKFEPNPHLNQDREKIYPKKGIVQPKFHPIEDEQIHQNNKWKHKKYQPKQELHQNISFQQREQCCQIEVYEIQSDLSCCQLFLSCVLSCFPCRQNYRPTVTFSFNNQKKILTIYQEQEWCSLNQKRMCCCCPPKSHVEIPYDYIIGIQRVRKDGKDKVRLNTKARNLAWDYKQDPRGINSSKVVRDLAQMCNKCGILFINSDIEKVTGSKEEEISCKVVFINNDIEFRPGIQVTKYQ